MRKFIVAVAVLLIFTGTGRAAVYNLLSVNGAEVVGDGPFTATVSAIEISPGFATPFEGYNIQAYGVYFSDADRSLPANIQSVSATVMSGPNGPSFQPQNATLNFSDDSRYLFWDSIFSHGAGDQHGLPGFEFIVTLPDNLSFKGVSPIMTPVPEPSTWAMLLLGFAMMAFASRRVVIRAS